jgi:hypothetical protein
MNDLYNYWLQLMTETPNTCPSFGPQAPFNLDSPNPMCGGGTEPSHKDVNQFFEDIIHDKKGLGAGANCDPMMTGEIVKDMSTNPNRHVIYRYSKGIRACDEAVKDLFTGLVVIDDAGVSHPVPIIWATQERAVAAIIQDQVRKDSSLVVDRLKLPMMSIYSSDFSMNMNRYTYHQAINYFRDSTGKPGLTQREKYERDTVFGLARGIPIDIAYSLNIWTYFVEDMNQILEQIVLKFSPIAYIRVQGVQWETIVRLDSIANNIDMEPGNTSNRVVKFQINMTAETYIPQPIRREKAVLKTRIDIANGLNDEEITEIISRLENVVDELKND